MYIRVYRDFKSYEWTIKFSVLGSKTTIVSLERLVFLEVTIYSRGPTRLLYAA